MANHAKVNTAVSANTSGMTTDAFFSAGEEVFIFRTIAISSSNDAAIRMAAIPNFHPWPVLRTHVFLILCAQIQ
jgi:hypothetical protein